MTGMLSRRLVRASSHNSVATASPRPEQEPNSGRHSFKEPIIKVSGVTHEGDKKSSRKPASNLFAMHRSNSVSSLRESDRKSVSSFSDQRSVRRRFQRRQDKLDKPEMSDNRSQRSVTRRNRLPVSKSSMMLPAKSEFSSAMQKLAKKRNVYKRRHSAPKNHQQSESLHVEVIKKFRKL